MRTVAKNFYTEFILELEELVHKGLPSGDPKKVATAKLLEEKLDEVLNSVNQRWHLGKLDPEEAARRKQAAEEFKARYDD